MPLRFSIWNKINPEHLELYGSFETFVDQIMLDVQKTHTLLDEGGNEKGTIQFLVFSITEQPSFVEYLKDGWFMNLSIAIDFTASNKDLHKLSDN